MAAAVSSRSPSTIVAIRAASWPRARRRCRPSRPRGRRRAARTRRRRHRTWRRRAVCYDSHRRRKRLRRRWRRAASNQLQQNLRQGFPGHGARPAQSGGRCGWSRAIWPLAFRCLPGLLWSEQSRPWPRYGISFRSVDSSMLPDSFCIRGTSNLPCRTAHSGSL